MIDVKEASKSALKYFEDIYGGTHQGVAIEEVELVELTGKKQYWYITIGYNEASSPPGTFWFGQQNRAYKIFKVDANDGKVVSMKIRDISK